jgi:hypothetical protein
LWSWRLTALRSDISTFEKSIAVTHSNH